MSISGCGNIRFMFLYLGAYNGVGSSSGSKFNLLARLVYLSVVCTYMFMVRSFWNDRGMMHNCVRVFSWKVLCN